MAAVTGSGPWPAGAQLYRGGSIYNRPAIRAAIAAPASATAVNGSTTTTGTPKAPSSTRYPVLP